MRKADYTLLATILKKYHTDALLSQSNNVEASRWIAATCDCIAVDFMNGASVNKVEFLKSCTPDIKK